MGFVQSVKYCFANYATFRGRAQRSQFWWFWLFLVIVFAIAQVIDSLIGWGVGKTDYTFTLNDEVRVYTSPGVGFLYILVVVLTIIPSLAVLARRLHDADHSGWWILWGYLLGLVCCIGFIILLVFTLQRGTPGPNRHGADPLAPSTM